MISLVDVGVSFIAHSYALADINLNISRGEFVYISGKSGAGKSTLLRLIYADLMPSRGVVTIEGRDIRALGRSQVPYLRRQIGVIFQDFKLLDHMTVFDNVKLALDIFYMVRSASKERIWLLLKKLGIFEKRDELVINLSGGEKQRVAIARALINDPKIILADEPTGNLDYENADKIMQILSEAKRAGATILMATHDEILRKRYRGRELILDSGRLVADSNLSGDTDE